MASLGTRIRAARRLRGWNQQQLAVDVGASVRAVADWENNRHRPRDDFIDRLERTLDVNLSGGPNVVPYETEEEALIWGLDQLSEAVRLALIEALRQMHRPLSFLG